MSSVSCSTRFVTAHLAQRGPQVAPRLNLTRYSKNKLRRSRREAPSRPVTCSFWETKNVSTRPGMGAEGRRPHRGGPSRRRGVVSARPEALARRFADDRHEPYRNSGILERKSGDLDGKGERRAVPQVIWTAADGASTWNQS